MNGWRWSQTGMATGQGHFQRMQHNSDIVMLSMEEGSMDMMWASQSAALCMSSQQGAM